MISTGVDVLVQAPRRLLVAVVRGYRWALKPWLGNACRFEPTCSAYALQALQYHGAWRGSALAGWRLLRCHPGCAGGCDPVPVVFPSPRAGSPSSPATGLFTRWVGGGRTEPNPTDTRKHP